MSAHVHVYAQRQGFVVDYGREAEHEIGKIQAEINKYEHISAQYPARWLAIKLLESDSDVKMRLRVLEGGKEIIALSEESIAHLKKIYNDDVDIIIADHRYGWINGLVRETVKRTREDRLTGSDKADRIITHRFLGVPIFLVAMWAVFKLTANVSVPYIDWIDQTINGPISNWLRAIFGILHLSGSWLESLFMEGIIPGVGGVLVFVPVMIFLYLALALLEDSGYMARAAFVMDRMMHMLGLHGKSFLPMLVGFGCTVPALYATRTLENEKDRILTGLLVPFMSCGARLPVYVLFAAIFFPENAGRIVFIIYLLGILTAITLGILLKKTLFKEKEESAFVMELPPYRMPTLRGIWFHVWERTGSFVRKAWTVILASSIVLWFLMATPVKAGREFANIPVNESAFALISKTVSPVLTPLGFNSWEASSALMTGLVAKEVIVTTLAQAYAVDSAPSIDTAPDTTFLEDVGTIISSFVTATGDTIKSFPLLVGINLFDEEESTEEPTSLILAVRNGFEKSSDGHGKLAAFAFMVFVLLYTPCIVSQNALKHELGKKWAWFSIIGQTLLAWTMALLVFQGGKLLGFG